jgi:hypothetical protein
MPDPGQLPSWELAELPKPLPFSPGNLFKIIGPGAILLASSIGGGEWLVGPAAGVKYGVGLMWIATIAIALQVVFNLEAIRYTLYTGEPIYGGFLRLKPGPVFWAIVYTIIAVLQLGWPALALSSAGSIFSMFSGRLPGLEPGDAAGMQWIATGMIVFTFLVLMFGGTIERMLEYASWFMLAYIFLFLVTVNIVFVPFSHWLETIRGFLLVGGGLRSNLDWGLMGALAATAGSGGIGNLTISNWIRDKGFGMGATVGAITSAVGGEKVKLSHVGKVFEVNPENLSRWREWWRYIHVDQIWLWGLFCLIGIFLTVNLATGVIPHGTPIDGLATGAYQADYMARHWWRGLWYLTLLNGFWILYSTHLGNTDLLVRTATDVLWMGSGRVRNWKGGRASVIYYGLLAAFSLWGFVAVRFAGPFTLFKMVANIAGGVLAFSGVQILIVNRKFLPPELRPPLWRQALLAGCVVFYLFFAVRAVVG